MQDFDVKHLPKIALDCLINLSEFYSTRQVDEILHLILTFSDTIWCQGIVQCSFLNIVKKMCITHVIFLYEDCLANRLYMGGY